MRFGPLFRIAKIARIPAYRSGSRQASPNVRFALAPVERLDPRQLLTTATPAVAMVAASTLDSQSVTISYNVATAQVSPITLGFYRSADANFSADDLPVESVVALPAVDSSGAATGTVGVHTVTVPIPGGLPLNPEHPYVLAVTNPTSTSAIDPPSTASFRTYSIGIITHGGIQYENWKKDGIPWTHKMAKSLLAEGYDEVIAYNWVAASNTPGAAAKQGPKLAQKLLDASAKFPANAPVDVHFIGHSEGAVVNTQAIVAASAKQTPQLQAGYWEDTLLDPHAANPDFPGRQYSVSSGPIGTIAKLTIDNYQARARDPLAFIPSRINTAQVFYQQSPANKDHNENGGIYNLWGEVPVKGNATYFNLTPSGIVHGGNNGVYAWYQYHVVPTLGNGDAGLNEVTLTGSASSAAPTSAATSTAIATTTASTATLTAGDPATPSFSGTAAPGATVFIRIGQPNNKNLRTVSETVAGADGTWHTTVSGLHDGKYRGVAVTRVFGPIAGKRPVIATVPLSPVIVASNSKSS